MLDFRTVTNSSEPGSISRVRFAAVPSLSFFFPRLLMMFSPPVRQNFTVGGGEPFLSLWFWNFDKKCLVPQCMQQIYKTLNWFIVIVIFVFIRKLKHLKTSFCGHYLACPSLTNFCSWRLFFFSCFTWKVVTAWYKTQNLVQKFFSSLKNDPTDYFIKSTRGHTRGTWRQVAAKSSIEVLHNL